MKKILFLLILLFTCLIAFATEAANYAIELENGSVFITDHYWEEGDHIKCLLFGGITGFEKSQVHSITKTFLETETPYMELETPDTESPDAIDKNNTERNLSPDRNEIDQPENNPQQPDADIYISVSQKNKFLDRRDFIVKEMKKARDGIRQAKEEGTRSIQKEFEDKFVLLNKDLKDLFDEVIEANGGTPPNWWPTMWDKDIGL